MSTPAENVLQGMGNAATAMAPVVLEALAASNPQDAAIAAMIPVVTSIIQQAAQDQASGKLTSTELIAKFKALATSLEATQAAWNAFAKTA